MDLTQFVNNSPGWATFVFLVGTITSVQWLFRWVAFVYIYFLRPSKSLLKHKGNWAVITGASWGIGSGFAKELAKNGINLVLIARSKDKLEEIASDLEAKYKIKTKCLAIDFDTHDRAIYSTIAKEISTIEVTMLVNNVGMSSGAKFFGEISEQELDSVVRVNIDSMNHVTRIVLPQMMQRKFGTIVFLSSTTSNYQFPTPLLSVYGGRSTTVFLLDDKLLATKAYANKLALALADELIDEGIEVLSITPAFVTSKMTKVKEPTLLICSETTLARETIRKLGYNMRTVNPWYNHAIQEYLSTFLDFRYGRKLVYNMFMKRREAQLKAIAKQKKQ